MSNKVLILDYKMGNINSIKRKLNQLGATPIISSKAQDIKAADKIILPGVGHFAKAMNNLKELGLIETLNEKVINKQTPILGICLGMQIMAAQSEEGHANGLGWVDAKVKRFQINDTLKYKVPHIGWNQVKVLKKSQLMKDCPNESEFYFVHAYYVKTNNVVDNLAETEYENKFICAIEKDNIFGVQFHPEKSHKIGEKIIENFINI